MATVQFRGKKASKPQQEPQEGGFEVLETYHEEDVGMGLRARLCKVKVYDKTKLEIRIFKETGDGELKPTRNKIDFNWSSAGTHEEQIAFLIGALIKGAEAMGIDMDEYLDISPSA